ncbi:restriction endonuclease subunit S [uncultured Desulfovibrio sp.]|uniref:restriction endonuclease subunit S n=1 Tax=uncultured Desulfovibrio sp. TaxID=167968 RepID=UPI00272BBBC1|nr:restriction endonuclease subunit S [uncultured Desulfovibrio sp.]
MSKVKMMRARDKKKGDLAPRLRFPEFRDAGKWEMRYGNDLFDNIINKNQNFDLPILAITQEHGAIPRSTIEYNVSVTEKSIENYKIVNIGDFIISLRSFQGGIEYSHFCGLCSPAYIILRKKVILNDVFFKFFFKSEHLISRLNVNIEGLRDGKMITYKQFSEVLLPFPSPAEQQRIADCLSSLDERIAAETSKLDRLKDHKKGLLKQLFPAEGETLPQLRFPEFGNSGKWQKIALGDICDIITGYTFPECLQGKIHGLYPFCKVSDISKAVSEHGGLLDRALNYVGDDELSILKAKPLPVGTTVFAKIGEALRLNRRAITTVECLIDNNAVGIKAKSKKSTDYFLYTLSQLIDLSEYCGGAVPAVNKTVLENISVVIPTSYEQQRIADCLSSLDELIASQTQKIDLLKDHKKGLMQQLFPRIDEVLA